MGSRDHTMPQSMERGHKVGHTTRDESTANQVARELTLNGYGSFDARDVLAGRVDDATVRQAVEVRR